MGARTSMTRALLQTAALCVALSACSAETLDAGGAAAASVPPAGPATTRATMGAMIDAVTMDETSLYFACEDGWIYALTKQGTSAPARLSPSSASFGAFVDGIAVDDTSVYWTVQGSGMSGTLQSAPKAGGDARTLASRLPRPWGLAVDDTDVYWANQSSTPPTAPNGSDDGEMGAGSLAHVPKTGGTPSILVPELDAPDFVALDGDGVVWHDSLRVARIAKSGTGLVTLYASAGSSSLTNLVVSEGTAYFGLDDGSWGVWSASTSAAGSATALASNVTQPTGVALVGSSVAWAIAGGPDASAIDGVPASGGSTVSIAPADTIAAGATSRALFLLADASSLYLVEAWSGASLTVAIRVLPLAAPSSLSQ